MANVFVLKDHLKAKTDFQIEIEGKVYTIPHSEKLDRKDLKIIKDIETGNTEAMYELLGRYIGQDVADALNYGEIRAIYQGWTDFIKESEGVTPGES